MKSILNEIFHFTNVSVPPVVFNAFADKFGDSINVEWLHFDDFYEAIFYLDEIEHIASFDSDGHLMNVKRNLTRQDTPPHIKDKAALHGELMNVIEIFEDEIIGYELIVRDEALIRYSLLLNEKGGLIQKSKL